MSDSTPDRAWAGRVVFPRSAAELRSTTICPACFTPLTSTVCVSCGLDLRHAASIELAASSATIADALDARLDIIGRIRRDSAAAAVAAPARLAAASAPAAVGVPAAPVAAPAVPTPAPVAPSLSDGPRRSSIQIALIIVGISLLSVFAAFGLVYAFVTYGSTVRMTIIVAGTLATMIAAGVLARRGLVSTAEGIAALGTVMLVLNAWALRLNDPLGLGSSPDALYWGTALLIVGATAALWSRTNALATPGVVGAGLLPIGAGLATGHLVGTLLPAITMVDFAVGSIAALATASVSWFVSAPSRPGPRRAAQIVAQSVGALAAVIGLASLVELDAGSRFAPTIAGLVLAAAAALHLLTLARHWRQRPATTERRAFDTLVLGAVGSGAAVAAIVGAVISAGRFEQDRVIVSAPLIAATLVALAAEQGWRRAAQGSVARTALSAATIAAAILVAIAGGLAAIVGAAAFVEAGTHGLDIIALSVGDPVTSSDPATIAALGALGLALALIALSWASLGILVRRARALTLIGGITLVAATPLLGSWWLVMTAFALLAIGAAIGLHAAPRLAVADARRALVALCIPLSTGAALGAFVTGWAVPRGWAVGLIVALVSIGIARPATSVITLRAGFLGLAAALVLGSMPELAHDLTVSLPALSLSAASALIGAAAVVIAVSQLGRLALLERRVVSAVAVVFSAGAAWIASEPLLDEAVAMGLIAVALSIATMRGGRIDGLVARALLPLAVARAAVLAAEHASLTTSLDSALVTAVALSALVVVAIVALVTDRRDRAGRTTVDISATATALILVFATSVGPADFGLAWLPVLVLAVLVLVVATSRDGLIGSTSRRRFVGWISLGIATIALWMRLGDAGVTAPEPYVLPLAGAMLLVVGASTILGRRRGATAPLSAAPLTAAALAIGLLPSAVHSATMLDTDGSVLRAIAVTLTAVALTTIPLIAARPLDAALPHMSEALAATGLGVLSALAVAHTIDIVAVTGGAALAGAALWRASLVVIVPSAVAIAVRLLATGRLRDLGPLVTLGVTALCATALGLSGAVDTVELVSVPLAIAALVIGARHLARAEHARSWPWLAPGLVVLLAPSLLAIDGAGEPLWRAVAIGVTAASVFVIGLRMRLQAAFVLGGTALLIHLLVQSWPLLSLVGRATEWWLWLGLAGVLIIALAARYERRLQNARDLATRIAQLR